MNRPPKVSGSIYLKQRKRGEVWYAKWREADPRRPGHLRQRKRLIGPLAKSGGRPENGYYTRKMAQAALDAILTDARRGITDDPITGTQVSFRAACDEFLRYIEHDKDRGVVTVKGYTSTIERHLIQRIGADTPLGTITKKQIEEVKKDLLATDLSRRTVQKVMVVLFGVLKHAKREEWIPANPAENVERVTLGRSNHFNVLTVEEVQAVARIAEDDQDSALFIVAAFTGLRMGELRALRWRDLDFIARSVHVTENWTHNLLKRPKSGKGRSLPMADQAGRALDGLSKREHFTEPGDLVFANPFGRYFDDRELRGRFYSALTRAGLGHKRQGDHPLRFHDLRHTFGTLCAASGVPVGDIQQYMGHANIQTTQIYMHFAPKHDAADRLTAAFDASPRPTGYPVPVEQAPNGAPDQGVQGGTGGNEQAAGTGSGD